jgi:hypothetical protein
MNGHLASRGAILLFALLAGVRAAAEDSTEPKKRPAYFPASAPDSKDGVSEYCQRWYSRHLLAMQEPAVFGWNKQPGNAETEVFRFLWLRSFHHPVAVRVQKEADGTIRLVTKMLDGKGGYAPGKLQVNTTKKLTDKEWSSLTKQIDDCKFWSMPTKEKQSFVNEQGLTVGWTMSDGAQWILEGTQGDKYHVVDRQSPDDSSHRKLGKYRDMCLFLLKLSDLDLDKKDVC